MNADRFILEVTNNGGWGTFNIEDRLRRLMRRAQELGFYVRDLKQEPTPAEKDACEICNQQH